MEVIDNFLPDATFQILYDKIMGKGMTWYFTDRVAAGTDKMEKDNFKFHHFAYDADEPMSVLWELFRPFIDHTKLEMKAVIRLLINMYPYTPVLKKHASHYDYDFKHKGAILYMNTCDGYTFVEGQKVYSVANRVLLHDPSKMHHSTTTTTDQRRVICNLNYL